MTLLIQPWRDEYAVVRVLSVERKAEFGGDIVWFEITVEVIDTGLQHLFASQEYKTYKKKRPKCWEACHRLEEQQFAAMRKRVKVLNPNLVQEIELYW